MKSTRFIQAILIALIMVTCVVMQTAETYAVAELPQAKVVEIASKETDSGIEKILMVSNGVQRDFVASTAPLSITYINVSISGAGSIVRANVACSGSAPSTSLTMKLQSLASGGAWATQSYAPGITFRTDKSVSASRMTTQTRYWKVNLSGTFLGKSINYNTDAVLFNSKAIRYPFACEIYSGRVLMMPPTNLNVDQTVRDSQFRNKYIIFFEGKYPSAKLDWTKYQIHHIRPLKYGGTNSLSNGMAIPNSQHLLLTTWWLNY